MAAADKKKPIIVIKKITVVAAGGHGGSWKVAFADFMTAMMAFFLVMWLVNQSEDVKKSVAEYFSTPSIIEYNFSNYGVELTLEKLFLDLVNEPLKAFEQFIKPADNTPNVMAMGHKKIQFEFLRNKLGEFKIDVEALTDEITFEIPSEMLFLSGSARPGSQFVPIMERVREVIQGLKDANIYINAEESVFKGEQKDLKARLAEARLDLISTKVEASTEGDNVDIFGKTTVAPAVFGQSAADRRGYIKFRIKQKFSNEDIKPKRVQKEATLEVDDSPSRGTASVEEGVPSLEESDPYNDVVDRVSGSSSKSK